MKRFVWDCTRVLASLFGVFIGFACWFLNSRYNDPLWVVLGYVFVLSGLLRALWIYRRSIRRALKEENSENKE